MKLRLFLCGLGVWIAATLFLRLRGEHLLHPGRPITTLMLFAISFPLMALITRRLCRRFQLPPDQWPAGAICFALPTLLLEPFSSAFFPRVFPNMLPEMAGVFGGWMLCCCAGALVGAIVPPGNRA